MHTINQTPRERIDLYIHMRATIFTGVRTTHQE